MIKNVCDPICYMLWDLLDFCDALSLWTTCKRFNALKIKEIINISECDGRKLNDQILRRYKDLVALTLYKPIDIGYLPKLKKMNMFNVVIDEPLMFEKLFNLEELWLPGCSISLPGSGPGHGGIDLNHMTNLKQLNIDINPDRHHGRKKNNIISHFNQNNIQDLNLEYLSICCNKSITDLSHMTKLRELDISETNLTDDCLKSLDLWTLIMNQTRITDLSHMGSLNTLVATEALGLRFIPSNLTELYIDENKIIDSLIHLTNLRILSINQCNQISDQSIHGLDQLEELYCDDCEKITDLNLFPRIKILSIGGNSGLRDSGIRSLNPIELNVDENPMITMISHMSNLRILSAKWKKYDFETDETDETDLLESRPGIGDEQLQGLNLESLNASNNYRIIDLSHMDRLRILYANGTSGIDVTKVTNDLIELHADDNKKITDLNHLKKLKVLHVEGKSGIGSDGIWDLDLRELKWLGNRNFRSGYLFLQKINFDQKN